MKKLIYILAMTLAQAGFGQLKYESYKMSYSEKIYAIQVAEDGEVYIDIHSLDQSTRKVGFIMKLKDIPDFISCLETSKAKFVEWKKVAIQNNVKEVKKPLDCTIETDAFFTYGDWQFDFNVQPESIFMVMPLSNGTTKYIHVIRSGKLVSSKNDYIESDGGAIIFQSAAEFDDFIAKIRPEAIQKFLDSRPKEDIFK